MGFRAKVLLIKPLLYGRNIGSFHNDPLQEQWRKRMLEAVTHPFCIDPPDQTCDVCTLVFFPTWTMLMPGNFWTAHCTYVSKLIHPLEFQSKKDRLDAYFNQLRNEDLLDVTIFPDREDMKGLERWAAGTSTMITRETVFVAGTSIIVFLLNLSSLSCRTLDLSLSLYCHMGR